MRGLANFLVRVAHSVQHVDAELAREAMEWATTVVALESQEQSELELALRELEERIQQLRQRRPHRNGHRAERIYSQVSKSG